MKKIRWYVRLGIWLGCSVFIALAVCSGRMDVVFETVSVFDTCRGYGFGVDSIDMKYRVFRIDLETEKARVIDFPWVDEELGAEHEILDICGEEDGRAWLAVCTYHWTGEGYQEMIDLYDCDFESQEMERVYTYILDGNEEYFGITPEEQKGDTSGIRLYLSENGQVSELAVAADGSAEETGRIWHISGRVFQHAFLQDGTLMYIRGDGSVYRSEVGGYSQLFYQNSGTETHNVNYMFFQEHLSFYNLDSKSYCEISYDDGELRKESDPLDGRRDMFGNLVTVREEEDGSCSATVMTSNYRLLPAVFGEEDRVITGVKAPFSYAVPLFLTVSILLFGAGALVIGARRLIICLNRGIFPTSVKIVIVAVPLAFISYFVIAQQVWNVFAERIQRQEQQRIEEGARALAAEMPGELFQSPSENLAYFQRMAYEREIRSLENRGIYSPGGSRITDEDTVQILYDFYACSQGEFYLLSQNNLLCTPVSYTLYGANAAALEAMAERGEAVLTDDVTIQEGHMISVFVPILADDGTCAGAVRAYVSMEQGMDGSDFAIQIDLISIGAWFLLFLLTVIVLFIVSLSLRPMKAMTYSARKMEKAGDIGNFAGRKRRLFENDEISVMEDIYRRMADNLNRQLREMGELKNANEPFVPLQLIRLLDREDVRTLELGDERCFPASVLSLGVPNPERLRADMSAEELYGFMGRAYELMLPPLNQEGGTAERFVEGGLSVLFSQNSEGCLRAAVSAMKALGQAKLCIDEEQIPFTAGITFGQIRLAVVGSHERMEIVAVSYMIRLAEYLKKMARRYGCRILTTKETIAQAEDYFSSFRSRRLGLLYVDEEQRVEQIYEIYEADEPESLAAKDQTKKWFEAGVDLFEKGKWAEARGEFARVLEHSGEDLAAGRYFYLCDRYMEDEPQEGSRYFEIYENS